MTREWMVYSQHAWVIICSLHVKSVMHKNQCACVCLYCPSVYLVVLSVTQRSLTKTGSGQGVGEGRARQEAVSAPCSLTLALEVGENSMEFSGVWNTVGKQRHRQLTCWQVTSYHLEDKYREECLRDTTAGLEYGLLLSWVAPDSSRPTAHNVYVYDSHMTLFISDDCILMGNVFILSAKSSMLSKVQILYLLYTVYSLT